MCIQPMSWNHENRPTFTATKILQNFNSEFILNNLQLIKNRWAFAVTGVIESHYMIQFNQSISLSEQNLIDCSGFGDCNGGFPSIALNYVKNNGIKQSENYKFKAVNQSCQSTQYIGRLSTVVNMTGPLLPWIQISNFEIIFNDESKMQMAIDTIVNIYIKQICYYY